MLMMKHQKNLKNKNINIYIDNIKGIASIYIKNYEKIVYDFEPYIQELLNLNS